MGVALEGRALAQTRSLSGQSVIRTPRSANVNAEAPNEPAEQAEGEGGEEPAPTPARPRLPFCAGSCSLNHPFDLRLELHDLVTQDVGLYPQATLANLCERISHLQ